MLPYAEYLSALLAGKLAVHELASASQSGRQERTAVEQSTGWVWHKANVKHIDNLMQAQLHVHSAGWVGNIRAVAAKHPVTIAFARLLCLQNMKIIYVYLGI